MRITPSHRSRLSCSMGGIILALFFSNAVTGSSRPVDPFNPQEEISEPSTMPDGLASVRLSADEIQPQIPPRKVNKPPVTIIQSDVLYFLNKDRLHGKLLAAVPAEYGIKWKQDNSDREANYSPSSVASVTLLQRPAENKTEHSSRILLTNGDIMEADIVSLDKNKLVVSTWYSGKIEIRREMVKKMNPESAVAAELYSGPNNLSEWTINESGNTPTSWSWRFKNGAIYSLGNDASIGLAISNMPDMMEFQFDASSRNDLSFTFFADNVTDTPGKCYELTLGSSIDLQRVNRAENNNSAESLGSFYLEPTGNHPSSRTHYNIYADRKKKTFSLAINGQTVKHWNDSSTFEVTGSGIQFSPVNSGETRISNIKACRWNGHMPEQSDPEAASTNDTIRLTNMDKVSGQVEVITDGSIRLVTPNGNLQIPLSRVVSIDLASDKQENARRNKNDIRASFLKRGMVTIQFSTLDKDKVTGTSENFGAISIPLGALNRIDFNIYREKDVEEEDSDD